MWAVALRVVLIFNFSSCFHTYSYDYSDTKYAQITPRTRASGHSSDNEHEPIKATASVIGATTNETGIFHSMPMIDGNTYPYEDGQYIEMFCENSKTSYLEWKVNQYDLTTPKLSPAYQQIFLEIRLSRNDRGLKISCITNSSDNQTVTFTDKTTSASANLYTEPIDKNIYAEGDPVYALHGYHCILIYQSNNSFKPSRYKKGEVLVTKVAKRHNLTIRSCAKLEQNPNQYTKFVLYLNKTLIIVKPKETIEHFPEKTTETNVFNVTNTNRPDVAETEKSNFPTIAMVVGSIAFIITVLLIYYCIVLLRRRRQREREDENIYAEPQVVYAVIDVNGQGLPPTQENTPYAKIIGVVKPKKQKLPKKIQPNVPLPPRNGDTRKRTAGIRKVTDDGEENCYTVIQHQRH